jgi:hypothetical protein
MPEAISRLAETSPEVLPVLASITRPEQADVDYSADLNCINDRRARWVHLE